MATRVPEPTLSPPNQAPILKPSDFPEPAPQAPTPRHSKATAEPVFSSSATADDHSDGVMDVNPTPRGDRQAAMALDTPGYIPDPFGGKAGPTPLVGDDLARRGGGPDERVTKRQEDLVSKFRGDKTVQRLLRDEAAKRLGTVPAELGGTEDGLAPAPDAVAAEADKVTTDKPAPVSSAADVAAIAKEQRENRELRQRIKAAESQRTEALRLDAWKKIAKDYPLAAAEAVLGLKADDFYHDDVQKRSETAGDKIKPDAAKLLESDDRTHGLAAELEEERTKRIALESRVAVEDGARKAAIIARADAKRWELCQREPDIGRKVVAEVQRLFREADEKAGGFGKGWRPKDDAEAKELTASVLDDMEKDFDAIGKRFSRAPATPAKPARPTPPPGQRGPAGAPGKPQEYDRYARPPKRESVEDRQDRLISRYRGVSLTDD